MAFGNKLLPSVYLLFFLASAALAAEGDLVQSAQEMFRAGQWEKSRQLFKQAIAEGEERTASFYYNHGTASLRAGAVGEAHALLWKAHLQSPFDGAIRNNLRLTREKLATQVGSVRPASWISWWPFLFRALPWQIWLIAALALLAPVLWQAGNRNRILPWQWTLLAMASLFFLGGALQAWQARAPVGGLLVAAKATSGPGKSYPEIATLEAGSLVTIEEGREGWLKVRLTNARNEETVGWLESPTVLRLN